MSVTESMGLQHSILPSPGRNNSCRSRQDVVINPDEPIRRQMCQRCPSCVRIRNISEFSSERTPLLATSVSLIRDSRCYDKVLIYLFVSILVFGTGLGTYLLILESEGATIEEFDYVSRENWGINSTFLKDIPPLPKHASKILLLQLTPNCTDETQNCLNYEEFLDDSKEKVKIFSGDVRYNYYQDKNGKIFEGRGFNYQSDCGRMEGCSDILSIGLIEDSNGVPSFAQLKKLKAFLDYCVMDYALTSCYEILVRLSSNREFEDLAFNLDEMNRKDGTCQYYT